MILERGSSIVSKRRIAMTSRVPEEKAPKASGTNSASAAKRTSKTEIWRQDARPTSSSDSGSDSHTSEEIINVQGKVIDSPVADTETACRDKRYSSLHCTPDSQDRVVYLSGDKHDGRTKVRYAAQSQAGSAPGGQSKRNQDSWLVHESPGEAGALLFGVFDGHGAHGQLISGALTELLPDMLATSEAWKSEQFAEALEKQIPVCNAVISHQSSGIDCSLSGSTAIVACIQPNRKLTVANVGDSRCFIGGIDDYGSCYSIALSTDHTPAQPDEARRIYACKGRIGTYSFEGKPLGPKRIWLQNHTIPGLTMTRSIGDCIGATIGVTAEPELVQYELKAQDRYLVVCSDGLVEFMSNAEIMTFVHKLAKRGLQPSQIASLLVSKARKVWAEEEQEEAIDDCTVIVAILSVPSAAKAINLSARAGNAPAAQQHVPAKSSQSSRACSQAHSAMSSKAVGGKLLGQQIGCVPRF